MLEDGFHMEAIIEKILEESLQVKETFVRDNIPNLILLAGEVSRAFTGDKKLLICGNGGSAADAQHIAAEFVNRFQMERPPLPAVALTTDTSVITSIANDYSFDEIFSKQIKAIGFEGDVLLVISTSGNSKNLVTAVDDARSRGLYTAAFLGKGGGKLRRMVDTAMVAKSEVTARVQEAHILAGHILCQLVDYILFQKHLEKS
jgi:D-sedoheptulose 7-phosphate isomerase